MNRILLEENLLKALAATKSDWLRQGLSPAMILSCFRVVFVRGFFLSANLLNMFAHFTMNKCSLCKSPQTTSANIAQTDVKRSWLVKFPRLYYPPGSEAESSHRQVVQASAAVVESKPKQMWTSTGRLMIGTTPRRALPESLVARKMASPRPPMTREEVTQLQLIEAAKAPPRQRLPDMAVRLASPRLASPRPGGGEEERATQRRVLVPKSGGRPLSARSGGSGAQRLSWAAPLPADSRDAGLEAEAVSSWRPAARPETRPAPLSAR